MKTNLRRMVDYSQLGIQFDIPDGWSGGETNGVVLLSNPHETGILLISSNPYSKSQLVQRVEDGIVNENGTNLLLHRFLENLSDLAVGGVFSGLFEGVPAAAYIVGIENPFHTTGVTITGVAAIDRYSSALEITCKAIFHSVKFHKTGHPGKLEKWKSRLINRRLTHTEHHDTSINTARSASMAHSVRKTIDLCSDGHFLYSRQIFIKKDTAGRVFDKEVTGGLWEVILDHDDSAILELDFFEGNKNFYPLTYSQGKLYLDNQHYSTGVSQIGH